MQSTDCLPLEDNQGLLPLRSRKICSLSAPWAHPGNMWTGYIGENKWVAKYDSQDTVFAIQQHTPEAFLLQAMDKRLEMAKDLKAGAKGLSWKQGYFLKAA